MLSNTPIKQVLKLSKIRKDEMIQPRQEINLEVVDEYAKAMKQGALFPPVVVYYDDKTYWLADGFHRIKAKESIGGCKILAEVRCGTRRDAILFATGANAKHGLQRTNADKRKAVERLLRDEEWVQWSDREIARRTLTTHTFVAHVRSNLGCLSGNGFQRQNRLVRRKGKLQSMNISNIGCKSTKSKV